jgi:hypothetical protein
MSNDAVGAILELLRKLKTTDNLTIGHQPIEYIKAWAGDHSNGTVLRLNLAIIEKIDVAHATISNSSMTDEAKAGLLGTLSSLSQMFSLEGLKSSGVNNYLPTIDSAITNFAIISSMVDGSLPDQAVHEISELMVEITGLISYTTDAKIDPTIKDTIIRQLNAMNAMLLNVKAVGVEPALAAYFELVVKLKKAEKVVSEESKDAVKGVWERIENWSDRFGKLADIVDSGSKFLPYVEKVPDLLKHLPFGAM